MKKLAQIVKERAEELEGKWVALVLEARTVPLSLPTGMPIQDVYPSDIHGDPLTGFEVLCYTRYSQECVDEIKRNGVKTAMVLIIASEPFVIKWYEYSGAPMNIKLVAAQQVSKGELGRFPIVHLPRFTRGAKGWSWVRLTDLADHLGLSAQVVWDTYYEIGREALQDNGMVVCIDGCGRDSQAVRISGARETFPYDDSDEPYECGRIWVPAGWARDVCYHYHFYKRSMVGAGLQDVAFAHAPSL